LVIALGRYLARSCSKEQASLPGAKCKRPSHDGHRNQTIQENRFAHFSALDAVDLNFDFVFHVALGRRLSAAPKPAVKSAFYVTSPASTHYAKLHAVLTDYSPLHVALFTDRAAAAKWLSVPFEALSE
jgi:hypothetical protein